MKRNVRLSALLLLLCALLTLSGCAQNPPSEETQEDEKQSETKTEAAETKEKAPVTEETEAVYALAKEDYLLPQDLFTRERIFAPEFVMIHFTSAVVSDPKNPYDLSAIRSIFVQNEVSVHYIIDRDGSVYCYVPENLVAYHAGVGTWKGEEKYEKKLNDYAIGIELAAIGSEADMAQYLSKAQYKALESELIGFTEAQYTSLKALVSDICERNNIPMDREHVIGHEEYSPSKTDPGELFDWNKLIN